MEFNHRMAFEIDLIIVWNLITMEFKVNLIIVWNFNVELIYCGSNHRIEFNVDLIIVWNLFSQ